MEQTDRPRFLAAYFEALTESVKIRGVLAVIPYKLLLCSALGAAVGYCLPADFFSDARWDISTAVFAGLLTFNALIIAISWSAFSKVFEIIAAGNFGAYLKAHNLLHRYLVLIGFMNVAQIAAALISAAALLLVTMDLGHAIFDRAVAALSVASTIYSLSQALSATRMMADLVWHKATFDQMQSGGATVIRMEGRG
jgi:hypothetical protein